jgi:hypothetical protein
MAGLLSAVDAAMSALVRLAQRDLLWGHSNRCCRPAGLVAYPAWPSEKSSWSHYVLHRYDALGYRYLVVALSSHIGLVDAEIATA